MLENGAIFECNHSQIEIIKHIGKGKGGNSYLARFENQNVVFKKMHYEHCDNYTFESNKLQSELRDYNTLSRVGIKIPNLICYDDQQQYLIKEYVDGPTIAELVGKGQLQNDYLTQIYEMCKLLYAEHLNIDYFPTNFVVENGLLYYIDFECNPYMEEWDFENWGIYFWANTKGMAKFLETNDHQYLSINGKPHKQGLEEQVAEYLSLKN